MARYMTANDIVNRVAVECGLSPVTDVFATNNFAFTQLTTLLTTCVQELMEMFEWQILVREFSYTVGVNETDPLDLPTDFAYMIPQTGWLRNEEFPLTGALSAQQWTYLKGRNLINSTIYAAFRFDQNKLYIFPDDPIPEGLEITFEYISRNMVQAASPPDTYQDEVLVASDTVLFPPNVITRMLRMKYLDAKGFDTTKATNDFWLAFNSWKGKDNSAPVLNQGVSRSYPYISAYNIPDTGYGMP